jgi:hypothetical protein
MMVKGFGARKAVICLLPKRFDTTKTLSRPFQSARHHPASTIALHIMAAIGGDLWLNAIILNAPT